MARILIIDDSPTEVRVLGGMAKKHGYEVITAETGEQGIEVAKEQKPDLILMDIVMPGLNGFQATHAISKDPATKDIPIIIVSTKGQETDKIWGMRQGASDYVTKPASEDELISKIKALLGD